MKKTLSPHAAAAAAIRKDLKTAFSGVKFRVKSKSFSMGDDVWVYWTGGPASEEVHKIVDKYQEGNFDGMLDLYEYTNTRVDIPQVKYVCCQRYQDIP